MKKTGKIPDLSEGKIESNVDEMETFGRSNTPSELCLLPFLRLDSYGVFRINRLFFSVERAAVERNGAKTSRST
ncbi:hypothetical protein V1477_012162 [Vespula maculifrons]|uniref:Uncharacterized protein n=4 Tax=Vespula TaxID=7451 RepID=A0A834JKI9_VESGE|nr:hypothetical protein HZH66_010922 [Vespula vulgaris]KAF7390233.1 hypothetical protein HZH68_012090 [Vespula germanica]KAF7413238.1 hypothetical protein H0235_013089 [Vespula pensylvanica]